MKKKRFLPRNVKIWIPIFAVICFSIVILSIGLINHNPAPQKDDGNLRPPMAYYGGQLFISRGYRTETLPDGAVFLGLTNFNPDTSAFEKDLDCNGKGNLYANPNDESILYLKLAWWDETIDGPKKYILLERRSMD